MIWLRFRGWLQEIDETSGGVGVVVFEEGRRHLSITAGHVYGGYLAHLTAWAEANRIPYQGVPVGTIKRHVTGKGNADKQAVSKRFAGSASIPPTTMSPTRLRCCSGRSRRGSEVSDERRHAAAARRRRH